MVKSVEKSDYIMLDPNDEETKKLYGDLLIKFNKPIYLYKKDNNKLSGRYDIPSDYIADKIKVGGDISNIHVHMSREDFGNNVDIIGMSGEGFIAIWRKPYYVGKMVETYKKATGVKVEKLENYKPLLVRVADLEEKIQELENNTNTNNNDIKKLIKTNSKDIRLLGNYAKRLEEKEIETYELTTENRVRINELTEQLEGKVSEEDLKEYVNNASTNNNDIKKLIKTNSKDVRLLTNYVKRLEEKEIETYELTTEEWVRINELTEQLEGKVSEEDLKEYKNMVADILKGKVNEEEFKKQLEGKVSEEELNKKIDEINKKIDEKSNNGKNKNNKNDKKKEKTKKNSILKKTVIGVLALAVAGAAVGALYHGHYHYVKYLSNKPAIVNEEEKAAELDKFLDSIEGTKKVVIDKGQTQQTSANDLTNEEWSQDQIKDLGDSGYQILRLENGIAITNGDGTIYTASKVKIGEEIKTIFTSMENEDTVDGKMSGKLTELIVTRDENGKYKFDTSRGMEYTVPDTEEYEVELDEIIGDYVTQLNRKAAGKRAGTLIVGAKTKLIVNDDYNIYDAGETISNLDWSTKDTSDSTVDEGTEITK